MSRIDNGLLSSYVSSYEKKRRSNREFLEKSFKEISRGMLGMGSCLYDQWVRKIYVWVRWEDMASAQTRLDTYIRGTAYRNLCVPQMRQQKMCECKSPIFRNAFGEHAGLCTKTSPQEFEENTLSTRARVYGRKFGWRGTREKMSNLQKYQSKECLS